MSQLRFPESEPLPAFWTEKSHPLYNHRTTSTLPSDSDIVIIGSGFAGACTAFHLLFPPDSPAPDPSPSITILEARGGCSGATGRNGGHLKPDTYFNVPKYIKLYGIEEAKRIARLEARGVKGVKELVEREGWSEQCDFMLTRAVDVCLDIEHAKACEAAWRALRQADYDGLEDVQFHSARNAERVSGVHNAKCAFTFTAGSIWPSKLVYNLLTRAIRAGANLQTHTPARTIRRTNDKIWKWELTTLRGIIRAKQVVFATNAYTSSLLPQYTNHVVPVRGICSHITPVVNSKSALTAPHMTMTSSIRHNAHAYDYLIPRPDGSIIVGGARTRFWHEPAAYFDVTDDTTLIPQAADYFDNYMQRHYKGWENTQTTTKVWTGIMGYSSDFMPHVGAVERMDGCFIAAGFSGHGMPQILAVGRALAEMIGGKRFEETGLPGCFRTGEKRLNREKNELLEGMREVWKDEGKAKL